MFFLPFTARADLALPVDGPVTSGVGWRLDPFGSGSLNFHRGVDIAAPVGTPVRVTQAGQVVFAGNHGGHGVTVIVEHAGGDRTLYGHNMKLAVKKGQQVETGAIIAISGNTGRSTGPHVHYEVLPYGQSAAAAALADSAPQPHAASELEVRRQQEQQLDEIVNNILRHTRSPRPIGSVESEG